MKSAESHLRATAQHTLAPPHWDARLALEYVRRAERSVLARRSHSGPLRVQRDLYPEGEGTCHTIVVHPPGGIAGGDSLALSVRLGPHSAALLTTPGAGKWYRTQAAAACQSLQFDLSPGAFLEWLPQETILFDGAVAKMHTRVQLTGDAAYTGWEILCFGRAASGLRFASGLLTQNTQIFADADRLWAEQAQVAGDDPLFASPIGLHGHSVCATLLAAGREISNDVLAACREVTAGEHACAGVTRLPRLLIARWLGDAGEDARRYFAALWALLRPAMKGCAAVAPRIWST
ncbi:MAG: urease accessory protein [Betaproteobacteria bacterium]|nr:urease accessory protein [Betaproteobacteria bacterium]